MKADIVVARKRHNDTREAFFAVNPEDILLGMRGGKIILIDASLLSSLLESDEKNKLSPVSVNGAVKFAAGDIAMLAKTLRMHLNRLPVPIEPVDG